MNELFGLFKTVLLAHIGTKTSSPVFHEKSQAFYEALFDVFHLVSEKRQDTETDSSIECDKAVLDTVDSLERALELIEGMIKEKPSIGTDNLLRGLADTLEGHIGNARAFLKEEDEKEEPVETLTDKLKKKNT